MKNINEEIMDKAIIIAESLDKTKESITDLRNLLIKTDFKSSDYLTHKCNLMDSYRINILICVNEISSHFFFKEKEENNG